MQSIPSNNDLMAKLKQDCHQWIKTHLAKPLKQGRFESKRTFDLRLANQSSNDIRCKCIEEFMESEAKALGYVLELAREQNDASYANFAAKQLNLITVINIDENDASVKRLLNTYDQLKKLMIAFTAQSLTKVHLTKQEFDVLPYRIIGGELEFDFINNFGVKGSFYLRGTRINKPRIIIRYKHPVMKIKLECENPIFPLDDQVLLSHFLAIVKVHNSGYGAEESDRQQRFINKLEELRLALH